MADGPPEAQGQQELTLSERELAERLTWFIAIRWFAGAAALAILVLAWNVFHIRFPVNRVVLAILALFFYNAILALTVKGLQARGTLSRQAIHLLAHLQVGCDLVLLGVIWHLTGGIENSFGIFFIFPMVWASELLERRYAFLHAALGILVLNAVAWGEYAGLLPHVHLERDVAASGTQHEFIRSLVYRDWHRVFMVTFSLSMAMLFTVYLAATVAGRLRHSEQRLEEAFRKLKSLETLKSHFMRKASHELRAPLAATHTLLKTVLMGLTGSVDPKQKEMIQRACERTGSLIALINDLLRYSRLEAETGVPAVYQPVSLFDVVRRTVELLSPSAEEKGLHLEVHLRPVHVLADEEGLTELVTNLVSNAIRYTPNGGRVSVAIEVEGPHAMLKVEDQGIGIKPDDLPHLFEEFFRSESARQFVRHGTGMGLAIVKKLVDSYGGAIDVASEPGRGTTFTVRLPLAPAE